MKVLVVFLIVPIISNGNKILIVDNSFKMNSKQPAERGKFPWQASITNLEESVFCGGALITTKWVLTAAHCVEGAGKFEVRLGTIKSIPPYEEDSVVIVTDRAIIHPHYGDIKLRTNIAVVDLKKDVKLSAYIQTIALGKETIGVGISVTLSGWGKSSDSHDISPALNYVKLITISNGQCRRFYRSIPNNILCCEGAFYPAICKGDGGSPLIDYDMEGNAVVVGIVSVFSKAACVDGLPSGHTRVKSFYDWILSSINK